MTVLPSALARQLPRFGEAGAEFARELPRRVKSLARRWRLRVGPPYEPGGVTSWTAPAVRRQDRLPVVLKVVVPHPEAAAEPLGLAAWEGRGAVRLLDHDDEAWALLLERLGPATLDDLPPARRLTPFVDLLGDLWSVEPPAGVPALADHASRLAELLAERPMDAGWDPGVVRHAIVTLRGSGAGTRRRVLLHGDLHGGNVLARGGGWAAIDPKPFVGEAAADLRQVLRSVVGPDPDRQAVGRAADALGSELGIDRDRILAWTIALQMDMAAHDLAHGARGSADEAYRLAAAASRALSRRPRTGR